MLEAYLLNAYILFKFDYLQSKLLCREFQRHIIIALLRNPAGQSKKKHIPEMNRKRKIPAPEYEWEHLPKKRHCIVYTQNRIKRTPLQPIEANSGKRRRPLQTVWGCSHPDCSKKAICKPKCWTGAHNIYI